MFIIGLSSKENNTIMIAVWPVFHFINITIKWKETHSCQDIIDLRVPLCVLISQNHCHIFYKLL